MFEETFEFLKSCDFSGGHVFSFSAMPGTLAFDMTEKVKPATIKTRTSKLLAHFTDQQKRFQQQKIGQIDQVMFESRKNSLQGNYFRGFTADYQRVVSLSDESLINQIRNVKITDFDENGDLFGVIASQNVP